jgi:hypothetical protein
LAIHVSRYGRRTRRVRRAGVFFSLKLLKKHVLKMPKSCRL